MLPYNFDYYKPQSIKEAIELYQLLKLQEKKPMYYGGGTEVLTLGRLNFIYTDAIIDLKGIPECNAYGFQHKELIIGSTLSLRAIEENRLFPLLADTSKEVADYTSRNKITIGGNICGQIFYRESVLPFLLSDSTVIIAGPKGTRKEFINEVFHKELRLDEGEFLVQIVTEKDYLKAKHISVKKRQQWKTGYPLLTVASLKKEGFIRFAFSGVCPYPFRSIQMENKLNDKSLSFKDRILTSFEFLPTPVLNDIEGSNEYRLFVLENTLSYILSYIGGEEHE
ncbi:FAD binding domain-containing protein [Peribacillus simplex]|jgi:CO/xanthine dehydrogenase FAD-binding subunit|uniref:FAD binding domain-containing protein n=1 Tax=Peribacillus simplex TaxID=1478 RepID=UPI0011A0C2DC|nr:FAD binding domain-containing protein [Peribacillus simplex]